MRTSETAHSVGDLKANRQSGYAGIDAGKSVANIVPAMNVLARLLFRATRARGWFSGVPGDLMKRLNQLPTSVGKACQSSTVCGLVPRHIAGIPVQSILRSNMRTAKAVLTQIRAIPICVMDVPRESSSGCDVCAGEQTSETTGLKTPLALGSGLCR